jgi:hypothetical protein
MIWGIVLNLDGCLLVHIFAGSLHESRCTNQSCQTSKSIASVGACSLRAATSQKPVESPVLTGNSISAEMSTIATPASLIWSKRW